MATQLTPSDPPDEEEKLLTWAETHGLESLKGRLATADLLTKEAQTTLTVLLAGVGGAGTYGIKVLEPGPSAPLAIVAASVCVYLALLSVVLVATCLIFKPYPAIYQIPGNLLGVDAPLKDVKRAELENMDKRIYRAMHINRNRSRWLNGVRLFAIASVVVAVVASFCATWPKVANAPTLTVECQPSAPGAKLVCKMTQ